MTSFSETQLLTRASHLDTEVLNGFDPISLEQVEEVKMMDRFDSKFFFNLEILQVVLHEVKDNYFVLETAGTRVQTYNTIYFDTLDNRFYLEHHNGRSKRMKLRKREYVDSGSVFLEIKQKNNKGLTSKKRMEIENLEKRLSEDETRFVKLNSNIDGEKLEPKFGSCFKRITLISKTLDERCTIDIDLHFNSYGAGKSDLNEMVIAELKQEKQYQRSELAKVFKANKVHRQSFSKYCFGRALNESDLKSNVFKEGLKQINNQIKDR